MTTEERDKDSISAMKRHGPIAKVVAWATAVSAIIGALRLTVPPIWDIIIGNELDGMKADIAQCQGDLEAQKKLLRAAVKVTEDRIIEGEKTDLELEGSIRLIHTEVRLRAGADVEDIPLIDNVPRTRSGRLRAVAEQNDELLSGPEQAPRPRSLIDDMRRQGAPVDALKLDD